MNGYVASQGNRWYAVVYEGVDPETGRNVDVGCRPSPAEPRLRHLQQVSELVGSNGGQVEGTSQSSSRAMVLGPEVRSRSHHLIGSIAKPNASVPIYGPSAVQLNV